jgi:hypothetical protein
MFAQQMTANARRMRQNKSTAQSPERVTLEINIQYPGDFLEVQVEAFSIDALPFGMRHLFW